MHILIIPSWYPSDVDDIKVSFIREQAQALVQYGGHQVGVISPQLSSTYSLAGVPYFRKIDVSLEEGVSTYRVPSLTLFRRIPYLGVEIWIREGMRLFSRYVHDNGKPDVLHAHFMFYGGLLAERISKKYDIPFVITEHNSGYARGFVKPWQLSLGAKAVKYASSCIAVSEKFSDYLDEVYKKSSGCWKFIPNMVSMRFFESSLELKPESTKEDFYFCTICNLNSNKGVDLLIKAFAESFLNKKNVKLLIGGEGPERLTLEELVESIGLTDQVSFLGNLSRDQVVDIISSCDSYVLSSYYETFGVVLAEALALGKPVVSTRCGGPESIVLPSDGFLVEKDNIETLAMTMNKLYDSVSNFDAQKIRENCLRRFSAPVIVNQLSALYEKIKLSDQCSKGNFK